MGKGITRRRYGRSHPRPGPRTRTLHPPRRTLWENPSSQPGRNLARKYKTAQNFRNWWLRITGTHRLRVSLNLLAIIAPSLQRLVRPIFSKQVAKAHGLSTSTIPKGPLQEGRQTELRGRSLEFFQMGYKYNRISEC